MADDYVLDTNVIMHAYDPRQGCRAAARAVLNHVLGDRKGLCVDAPAGGGVRDGFIWAEYEDRGLLRPSSLAHQFFLAAIKAGLVRPTEYSRHAAFRELHKCLGDKTDRRFIQTAAATLGQHLVSDDSVFFPRRRESARRLNGICSATGVRITKEADTLP